MQRVRPPDFSRVRGKVRAGAGPLLLLLLFLLLLLLLLELPLLLLLLLLLQLLWAGLSGFLFCFSFFEILGVILTDGCKIACLPILTDCRSSRYSRRCFDVRP